MKQKLNLKQGCDHKAHSWVIFKLNEKGYPCAGKNKTKLCKSRAWQCFQGTINQKVSRKYVVHC